MLATSGMEVEGFTCLCGADKGTIVGSETQTLCCVLIGASHYSSS